MHEALAPLVDRLGDLIAVALRSLARTVADDLAAVTAASTPWEGPDPEALTEELRRRHDEAWRARHEGKVERVGVEAMRRTYDGMGEALGVSFGLDNPVIDGQVRQLRNRSTLPDSSWALVRESLQGSQDDGVGIPEAARRLRADVGGIAAARGRMIARTELVGIANRGSITAARLVGLGGFKSWLATNDARTRNSHALAHGQTVPLDDAFTVMGETLDYPGDPAGSAANVINCRCTVTYSDNPEGFTGQVAESDLLGPVPVAEDLPQLPTIRDTLDVQFKSAKRAKVVDETLDAMERVHRMPEGAAAHRLPLVQGGATKSRGAAYFQRQGMGGLSPVRIRLNVLKDAPPEFDDRINLAHEFGHYLDHWHMPGLDGQHSTAWTSRMALLDVNRGLTSAERLAELSDYHRSWVVLMQRITESPTFAELGKVQGSHGTYMRSGEELFARSYAQWIGTRSGNSAMVEGYAGAVARRTPQNAPWGSGRGQWPADEFAPIADAFDDLFRSMGLLT